MKHYLRDRHTLRITEYNNTHKIVVGIVNSPSSTWVWVETYELRVANESWYSPQERSYDRKSLKDAVKTAKGILKRFKKRG
jgi:hypothetical protein